MKHTYNEIELGAEKPFTILHITDVHLTHTGIRDSFALHRLAKKRSKRYTHSENVLNKASTLAKEKNALIVNTGDMTDFFSYKNLKYVKKFTENNDCFFVNGNHDFRPFGGMEYDVPESMEKNLEKVQSAYKNSIRFSSKVINGINIVGIDNAYYRFTEEHFNSLKNEVAKGMPIILFMHVPLYGKDIYDLIVKGKRKHASLVSVPEELMKEYPDDRFKQQIADETTRTVTEYIKNEPLIKLVVCGHLHKSFETVLDGKLPQYMTGIDEIREIRVK